MKPTGSDTSEAPNAGNEASKTPPRHPSLITGALMQPTRLTATLLVLAGALGAHNAFAQAAGLHRTDLVHHD